MCAALLWEQGDSHTFPVWSLWAEAGCPLPAVSNVTVLAPPADPHNDPPCPGVAELGPQGTTPSPAESTRGGPGAWGGRWWPGSQHAPSMAETSLTAHRRSQNFKPLPAECPIPPGLFLAQRPCDTRQLPAPPALKQQPKTCAGCSLNFHKPPARRGMNTPPQPHRGRLPGTEAASPAGWLLWGSHLEA